MDSAGAFDLSTRALSRCDQDRRQFIRFIQQPVKFGMMVGGQFRKTFQPE
jgi:hypothetical protein